MKKKFLKSTIVVVAVAASSLGAWRAYDAYGVTDSTLLTENIEALTAGSDPGGLYEEKSNKAFEYFYQTEYKITGWKANLSISGDIIKLLGKYIGKKISGGALTADLKKYTQYIKLEQYQKNCIYYEGSNCVCSDINNGKWFNKPGKTPDWWGDESKICN